MKEEQKLKEILNQLYIDIYHWENSAYPKAIKAINALYSPEPQVVCPDCEGIGYFEGIVGNNDESGGCHIEQAECVKCHGTGKVPLPPNELLQRPKVVCLCGSTRFGEAFQKAQFDLTMAGVIVLTIGCNMKSDTELFKGYSEQELKDIKTRLDELHKRKIDLADEVLILNVGNYIGESTKGELEYAKQHGKTIRFLESNSR